MVGNVFLLSIFLKLHDHILNLSTKENRFASIHIRTHRQVSHTESSSTWKLAHILPFCPPSHLTPPIHDHILNPSTRDTDLQAFIFEQTDKFLNKNHHQPVNWHTYSPSVHRTVSQPTQSLPTPLTKQAPHHSLYAPGRPGALRRCPLSTFLHRN